MRLRDPFTKNLGLKFLALVLAVVLWFTAVGKEMAEVGLTVPLEMVNFPEEKVVANHVPDGISVRIRGSVTLTRQVANRRLRFSLDLADAQSGPNQFTLHPDALGLPRGLEVTRLTPSTITVELEGMTQKQVSLLPVIKGEPVSGFMIEDITLDPKTVTVRGPESVIDSLDILWTEPIDVTQMSESGTIQAQPSLPGVAVTLVDPVKIEAHLKIGDKAVTRTFHDFPVEAINTDKDYTIEPKTVTLTIRGPHSTMVQLSSGKALHARINLADLGPGKYVRSVEVAAPPDMDVIHIEPEKIQVEILEKPVAKND